MTRRHLLRRADPGRFCRGRSRWLLVGLLLGLPSLLPLAATGAAPRAENAGCADAYEDDGVPAQARPLGLGETQAHTFCPAGDADWLTFYAAPGSAYQVTTTNAGAGVSSYVYLFGPDGQTLLARNDDAPGAQPPGSLHFTPATAGWYFLQAKNRGDQGGPDARYTIRLDRAGGTTTPTPAAPTAPPPTAGAASPPALVTGAGQVLQPLPGDAGSNGLPVFDAGPASAQQPDQLAPNGTFEQARLLIPGAVYRHLNFVGNAAAVSFFAWHAKPFDCYAAQTGDLSPGLDTALLLWRPAPTREGRILLAQNDDAQAHSADLSSHIRWCNPTAADTLVVLEVRNYAGVPVGGAAGKSYSLALLIDPPPPTRSAERGTRNDSQTPPVVSAVAPAPPAAPPAPILPPTPPLATALPVPTATPIPSLTPTQTSTPDSAIRVPRSEFGTPSVTATRTALPTATGTGTPTPTVTPAVVTVDVVVYFGTNSPSGYGATTSGPDPGSGVPGLLVQVVDLATNHPLAGLATQTDAYGHARLAWAWQGPVQLAVPQLLQTQLIQARDLALPGAGGAANTPPGHLYVPIRVQPYPLPIVQP